MSERLLETAIAALARGLERTGASWMVIGGIAIIARGVRRMTTDVDVVVRGDAVSIEGLLAELGEESIVPRIADAAGFASANLVLLMRHAPTRVDIDLSLAWSDFELAALASASEASFGQARLPMSTASDLVVFKAIAGRPKDVEDAEALLVLHPEIDTAAVRARVAELSALADAPELLESFDSLARRVKRDSVG